MSNNTNNVNPIVAFVGGLFGFVPKAAPAPVVQGFAALADEVVIPEVVAPTPTEPAKRPLALGNGVVSLVFPIKGAATEMAGGTGDSIALRYSSARRFNDGGTCKVGGAPISVNGGNTYAGVGLVGDIVLKLADLAVPSAVFKACSQASRVAAEQARANPEGDLAVPQLVLWVTVAASAKLEPEQVFARKDGKVMPVKGFLNLRASGLVAFEVIFPGDPRYVAFKGDDLAPEKVEALLSVPSRAAAASAAISAEDVVAQAMADIDAMLAGGGIPAAKPKAKVEKTAKKTKGAPVDPGRPPAFDVDYGDDTN